jgi:3-oxoacyl-[acyl-carrier-protein] synthase II
MAWTTALGDDLDLVWEQLLIGRTGLTPVLHEGRLRNDLAAMVPSVPGEFRPQERMLRIGVQTARRALTEAHWDAANPELRLVLGTSLGTYLEDDPPLPLHAWADALGQAIGLTTAPLALSTACSSGADAILFGAELIRAGAARCCVCGGVDVLTLSKRLAHSALGTMSPTRLRAFDIRHDGTLLGEGAGFLVLEAAREGRLPLAVLRGCGSANEAGGMTATDPAGRGARYALQDSLSDAQLSPEAIGLINAHGSGTPMNDATESQVFREVFGRKAQPIVFATKGNFGHSLGATGAIEAIALILALRHQQVPPIAGLEQPDPEFPLPLPQGQPVPCDARFGLSLTLGFGGFDTSLVFEVSR